jgi:putative membrane protein
MWNRPYHHWSGGGWLLMLLVMIVFWGAIAWAIITIARHNAGLRSTDQQGPVAGSAQRILEERFARGEIDAAEFQQRRDVLRDGR